MKLQKYTFSAQRINIFLLLVVLACYAVLLASSNYTILFSLSLLLGSAVACVLCLLRDVNNTSSILFFFCSRAGTLTVILFCIALLWDYRIQRQLDQQLPIELDGKTWVVEGQIDGVEASDYQYQRFLFSVESISAPNSEPSDGLPAFSGTVRLSWKTDIPLVVGETKRFLVKLKRPRGFVNPNAFDYQLWLLGKGIQATGYVKRPLEYDQADRLSAGAEETACEQRRITAVLNTSLRLRLAQFRKNISEQVLSHTQNLSQGALIRALLLGDRKDVSASHWVLFQATGTIHLMAISGLHIGMIAGISFLVASCVVRSVCVLLGFRRGRVLVFEKSVLLQRAVIVSCSVTAAFFYAYLAGFSVPTQRAFFCVLMMSSCWLFGLRTSFLRVLIYVALLVMVLNPISALQPGFILSFSAVAALVFSFSNRHVSSSKTPSSFTPINTRMLKKLVVFGKAQWVLFVALAPLLLSLNLPISSVAPAVNSIAIPVFSALLMPLLFIGLCLIPFSGAAAQASFELANGLLHGFVLMLELCALPAMYISQLSKADLAVLGGVAVFLLLPRAFGFARFTSILLVLSVSYLVSRTGGINNRAHYAPGTPFLNMTVLDVGQGLSTVIEDEHGVLIYDIGAKFSDSFSIADRILLPHLYTMGNRQHYNVVISHADNDHAGNFHGFIHSLDAFSAGVFSREKNSEANSNISVLSGEPAKLGLGIEAQCKAAQGLNRASIANRQHWTVLWPNEKLSALNPSKISSNNKSCVLLGNYGGVKLLLMGDVEREVEKQLLAQGLIPANVDVLLAGHHGSNSSSIAAFVARTQPTHVIFSAGYKNRYHHPSNKVLARFQAAGSTVWNTAMHGAVQVNIDDGAVHVSALRCDAPKRWYWGDSQCVNEASSYANGIRYD